MSTLASMDRAEFKAIRERLGWTQTEIAERLGVTRDAIAKWEAGVRGISEPVAIALRAIASEARKKKRRLR